MPVTHRLGDEAAQRRNGLFDRGASDDLIRHVLGTSRLEFLPEALVRPILQPSVEVALDVVAAQYRAAHGGKRKAAAVVAIAKVGERRRLRHDAEPSERITLFVGPQHGGGDRLPAHAMEAVAAGDVIAVDPAGFAILLIGYRMAG